jgi:sporulation protein YlmC with PRC-barrel domain
VSNSASDWKGEDLHLGAKVFSADGKEIGQIVHVLVDGDYRLKALVVKESRGFSGVWLSPRSMVVNDEFIVPPDAVKSVSHERIELKLRSADARRLQPYLSYREKGESVGEEAEDVAAVLGSSPEVPGWLEQVANKPAGELEIDGGENVMLGHTGKKLGTVKDVLFDGDDLVGVVLRPEGLFKKEVILPRRFLSRSDDLALFAELDEADLEHLEPFEPKD